MSEQLFYSRKKKGGVRDAAVRCGGAVSLCGSRWAFTSRSKAATVWLPLHWLVGVGTQNWGIVTLCVSATDFYFHVCLCTCCLFWVCDVAELWAFWDLQSSSTLLCDREGEAHSETAPRFHSGVEKRATKAAGPWKSFWLKCLQSGLRKPETAICCEMKNLNNVKTH